MDVKATKKLLRKKIWLKLEKKGVARFPLPCFGRIPNFIGSDSAAAKVRLIDDWQNAKVVFVNPDYAQRKVRECALLDGKILAMASPRLKHGFIVISPKDVKAAESFASTIKGAFKYGRTIDLNDIARPDLVVEGAVAVDLRGNRLGKGHGYGDFEISILRRIFGAIHVVTTVHDTQIVEAVPYEEKDEKIGLIVTPTRIIRISP